MKTLLQINTTLNYGSTGKIAEQIGLLAQSRGWNSYIAHGPRMKNPSALKTIQTNSLLDEKIHGLFYSLLCDKHGLGSTAATKKIIEILKQEVKPDIVHLHNVHGYYLNYELLFKYLKEIDVPIIWTLHDCWSFTGHCCYFDKLGCDRWKSMCCSCPGLRTYPATYITDNSQNNYLLKKKLFTAVQEKLTLVPVSEWLSSFLNDSFLSECNVEVIHNGIDINRFTPQSAERQLDAKNKYGLNGKKIILGVSSPWTDRKGFTDFFKLRELLPEDFIIVLVGVSPKQQQSLPNGIVGVQRTDSVEELATLYSVADAFVNPTYEDNYPTVNLEAISCGTPVITYQTGGSPESITTETGIVIPQGDIEMLAERICNMEDFSSDVCKEFAINNFDNMKCFDSYLKLYDKVLCK